MKLSRLKKLFFLYLSHLPMPSRGWRSRVIKWAGVKVLDAKNTFIGANIIFDTNFPEDIIIESGVRITVGCIFLSHFLDVKTDTYLRGKIRVSKNAYIGCSTIICKPVTIGEGAIVGAGSVVTKDIPPYQVWAGNPAKFIRAIDRDTRK